MIKINDDQIETIITIITIYTNIGQDCILELIPDIEEFEKIYSYFNTKCNLRDCKDCRYDFIKFLLNKEIKD